MNKPHYGIDAPPVIIQLLLTGVGSLIIGIICFKLLGVYYANIALILLILFLIFSAINFIFTILMLWSSLFGKLIMRDKIIDLLNLQGNEHVLDVGCGRGLLLVGIAKKLNQNGKIFGIDLWRSEDLSNNKESLTRQNAKLEGVSDRVELISGDMTQMKFDNNQFDAIVSSLAIHNIPTNEGRYKAIQEIVRVLKPEGRLIILDFQHTREYLQSLKQLGWSDITLSRRYFIMFPPVRLIIGTKLKEG
jgi:ubiquinone/menaquinone biosynthesis C-methylase UbiE